MRNGKNRGYPIGSVFSSDFPFSLLSRLRSTIDLFRFVCWNVHPHSCVTDEERQQKWPGQQSYWEIESHHQSEQLWIQLIGAIEVRSFFLNTKNSIFMPCWIHFLPLAFYSNVFQLVQQGCHKQLFEAITKEFYRKCQKILIELKNYKDISFAHQFATLWAEYYRKVTIIESLCSIVVCLSPEK